MPTLHFVHHNYLPGLHDAIVQAHPEYAPILSVQGKGDDIWLSWDEAYTLDEASLTAIVAAHVPNPPPPPADPATVQKDLEAMIDAANTPAKLQAVLKELASRVPLAATRRRAKP